MRSTAVPASEITLTGSPHLAAVFALVDSLHSEGSTMNMGPKVPHWRRRSGSQPGLIIDLHCFVSALISGIDLESRSSECDHR
jgi:hypothetical protein